MYGEESRVISRDVSTRVENRSRSQFETTDNGRRRRIPALGIRKDQLPPPRLDSICPAGKVFPPGKWAFPRRGGKGFPDIGRGVFPAGLRECLARQFVVRTSNATGIGWDRVQQSPSRPAPSPARLSSPKSAVRRWGRVRRCAMRMERGLELCRIWSPGRRVGSDSFTWDLTR